YRQMNALSPLFLSSSSKHGGGVDRLSATGNLAREFRELLMPQNISSMIEYSEFVARMSERLEERMRREGTLAPAMERFPKMFVEGRLSLTPDKMFSPARLRPHLRLPRGNISLEFRAIDAIGDAYHEADILGLAIKAFDSAISEPARQTINDTREFLAGLAEGNINHTAERVREVAHELRA